MLTALQDPNIWLMASVIFIMRAINLAMDTVRMLTVMRGMKLISFILGVLTSLIYIITLGSVLSNTNNTLYILAYALGFAAGGWVGMIIEERLAFGFVHISVVSSKNGVKIANPGPGQGWCSDFIGDQCTKKAHEECARDHL
jgi:uncharacterized protein YebE (UPF0316 family)